MLAWGWQHGGKPDEDSGMSPQIKGLEFAALTAYSFLHGALEADAGLVGKVEPSGATMHSHSVL